MSGGRNSESHGEWARVYLLRVAQFGCPAPGIPARGKGEFLIRLAEAYGVNGLGIDLSQFYIAEARKRQEIRAPEAEVTFQEMDGAEFEPKDLTASPWRPASVPVGSSGGIQELWMN